MFPKKRTRLFVWLIMCSVGAIALGLLMWYTRNTEEITVYEFSDTPIAGLAPLPDTQEACLEKGGVWGTIGIWEKEQCNMRTSDGGNGCIDSKACESLCIAKLSESEIENLRKTKKPMKTRGVCADWRIVVGCHPVVIEGVVPGLMCID